MQGDRQLVVARISAETSASAHLAEALRWLIEAQSRLLRLVAEEVPALGQASRLKLGRPITAPRALLCALWLFEDVEAGECLMAGQLRFVAHPTESDIRMSFSGGTTTVMRQGPVQQVDHAARQLLQAIAGSIERPGGRVAAT
ncbi:MAG TPA: hypothetical protein VES90_09555 [Candidatus Eisenbacteria bacterium]|nr:hypothetical protein [Candidatus Eisenbacteria bacterium]